MNGNMVQGFAAENNEKNILQTSIDATKGSGSITKEVITNESNSIINGQVVNSKPILTLENVIKSAIDNSDKLTLKSKEITMYRNKMDIQDKNNDFYESINQKVYDFPYDKLELQEKQTKQSEAFLEDQISNDITGKYNTIIMKQIDINKAKTNLEIKNKELSTVRTKVSIGMATDNQLNDKQIEVKSVQDDIKAKEDSLKNNVDYLGVLIGLNLSNYSLDQSIQYDIFKIDGSVDGYFDDKIDTYLKYNNDMIKEQIKSTNTKLRYAKSQVDIGMMTENTYKAQVLKSEDLDTALRNLINTYNTLANSIQKPWILISK